MVAGIAHDIANPAGLILANQERAVASIESSEELLDTCFKDVEDDETQAVYRTFQGYFAETNDALRRVELGTQRITAINSAIRNQARRDQTIDSVVLRPVIDECLVIVGNRLKDIDVEVHVSDALSIEMIRSQFGQVLMNLLANADAVVMRTSRILTNGRGGFALSQVSRMSPLSSLLKTVAQAYHLS